MPEALHSDRDERSRLLEGFYAQSPHYQVQHVMNIQLQNKYRLSDDHHNTCYWTELFTTTLYLGMFSLLLLSDCAVPHKFYRPFFVPQSLFILYALSYYFEFRSFDKLKNSIAEKPGLTIHGIKYISEHDARDIAAQFNTHKSRQICRRTYFAVGLLVSTASLLLVGAIYIKKHNETLWEHEILPCGVAGLAAATVFLIENIISRTIRSRSINQAAKRERQIIFKRGSSDGILPADRIPAPATVANASFIV